MTSGDGVDPQMGSRLQHKLEQLQEAVPEGLTQAAPWLPQRLHECFQAGNVMEAERMLNHALALINSSRNCLSCHN